MVNENNKTKYDVVVIGGGASGLMTAAVAGKAGKSVLIIEKNKSLGEKLKITGGGRCNITNAEFDTKSLLANYGKAKDFLFSPFSQFGVKDTFSYFKDIGVEIVVEARKRAFPSTQKALDVYNALYNDLSKYNVTIIKGSPVVKMSVDSGEIKYVEDKGGNKYYGKSFVVSTGGYSHPETGSTGDGFKWLEILGHKVAPPTPSIVPLRTKEKWVADISGVSLSFMKITFFLNGKRAFAKKGKILFTHFGLSSPLILNSSKEVGDLLHGGEVTASIDMYPDTDIGSLDKILITNFEKNKNKAFKNVVKELTPDGMHTLITALLSHKIDVEKKVHSITKEERRIIVDLLKGLPLTISGLMGYDRAVIADGGVSLSEIDTKTMRSKKVKNLFLTGDILNVNRPSGGYSLQLCWTTGYVAGMHA